MIKSMILLESLETPVTVLGDPHIGKVFKTGVPLHRLGDQEKIQMDQFEKSLMSGIEKYHVCVGDIFDKFVVPNHILLSVFKTYKKATLTLPERKFFILEGNHDASRDIHKTSSFDLLKLLLEPYTNIFIVSKLPMAFGPIGFIPWHPFKTSTEMAELFIRKYGDELFEVIFTHNDIESFGDKTDNLIQTELLGPYTDKMVTGHIHTPSEFSRDNIEVYVVGSMMPYSHSEDPNNEFYETLTLAEFELLLPYEYKDLNIRLLLSPGEDLPVDIDCLSLTSKRMTDNKDDEQVDTDEFMNLDLKDLLAKRLGDNPVAKKILTQFEEMGNVA